MAIKILSSTISWAMALQLSLIYKVKYYKINKLKLYFDKLRCL